MGLARAGFDVTGVDIEPHPRYPFRFVLGDALDVPLDGFDLIWASPPCQRYTVFARNTGTAARHPDLVPRVRRRLVEQGTPYIIENVPGAPLRSPLLLCGSMFGLGVRRHRLFETSFSIGLTLTCNHERAAVPVYGHGTPQHQRRSWGRNVSIEEKRDAMGIDWMNRDELSEAIPPAYSQWIAERFLEGRRARDTA